MNEETMTQEQMVLHDNKVAQKDLTDILVKLTNACGWHDCDRQVMAYNEAFEALLEWKFKKD